MVVPIRLDWPPRIMIRIWLGIKLRLLRITVATFGVAKEPSNVGPITSFKLKDAHGIINPEDPNSWGTFDETEPLTATHDP